MIFITDLQHVLVPKHELVSEEEKKNVLEKYSVEKERNLPHISLTDPAIKDMKIKAGDLIKITRKSATAGQAVYYRLVIE